MKLRTYLYLATVGCYKMTARERKLIRHGFTLDAVQSIIERTSRNQTVEILQRCLGLSIKNAERLTKEAMHTGTR